MKHWWSLAYLSWNFQEDSIIFNQTVQLHDAQSIHAQVGQKLIIRHACTILQLLSQLLSHCLYEPRKQYLDAFKTANSAKMWLSMSSSELSSSSKHRQKKAFLTQCSACASHSFIEIALLESLGILQGFFHMWWVCSTNQENNTFCYFCMFWGGQSFSI